MIKINTPRDIINAVKTAPTVNDRVAIVQNVSQNFISYKAKNGQEIFANNKGGQDIEVIQSLLIGLGFLPENNASGVLDTNMFLALEKFAKKYNLKFNPKEPLSKQMISLFLAFEYGEDILPPGQAPVVPPQAYSADKYNWPPLPNFRTLNLVGKEKMFGKVEWTQGKGGGVIVTNNFIKDNIITIDLPQLAKIKSPGGTKIRCHKLAAQPILRLWREWENMGLLSNIENWMGCQNTRFVRGYSGVLSPHTWGIAFDINTLSNGLGKMPPAVGEKGCLRELVPIANKLGFFWGGHFKKRKDGMHFELAKLDTQNMIA